jgi:hypothetical protein
MKFFYFLVHWDQNALKSKELHDYFFINGNGFVIGMVLAVLAALVLALIFYFVLGRNVRTANFTNWLVCGIAAIAITFGVSDFVFIGKEPAKKEYANQKQLDKKLTYKYSFYRSLDKATTAPRVDGHNKERISGKQKTLLKANSTLSEKKAYMTAKNTIVQDLNKGRDVRYPYSINTTIWCAVFFFLFSLVFKGMSVAAKTTPIIWPYNS